MLAAASERFLQLIRDIDDLVSTRSELLLGCWLRDAKRWAGNDEDRRLYEWNARNLLTLWGPSDSILHEYSHRQWGGLLTGFYLPRWEMFFQQLDQSLAQGKPFDEKAFEKTMQLWEERWTHGHEQYPTSPNGDAVAISRRLWDKYAKQLGGDVLPNTAK